MNFDFYNGMGIVDTFRKKCKLLNESIVRNITKNNKNGWLQHPEELLKNQRCGYKEEKKKIEKENCQRNVIFLLHKLRTQTSICFSEKKKSVCMPMCVHVDAGMHVCLFVVIKVFLIPGPKQDKELEDKLLSMKNMGFDEVSFHCFWCYVYLCAHAE